MELLLDIKNLNVSEILSDQIFLELLEIESDVEFAKFKIELLEKSKLLGIKLKFETMLKAYEREKKEFDKKKSKNKIVPIDNCSNNLFIPFKTKETRDGKEVIIQSISNICTALDMDKGLSGKIKYNILSYSPFIIGDLLGLMGTITENGQIRTIQT